MAVAVVVAEEVDPMAVAIVVTVVGETQAGEGGRLLVVVSDGVVDGTGGCGGDSLTLSMVVQIQEVKERTIYELMMMMMM